ncbi:MAG TPA: cytochrome c oxidase subunit 3 [Acidimicrobiia bacterium]|nr:cytochrome c oxidase subunit 3 [Acidimicrobiia bacterium]
MTVLRQSPERIDDLSIAVAPPRPALRRSKSLAWWGMIITITTESMIFAGLLSSYGFLRASAQQWPPPGVPLPEIPKTAVFSALLIGSSLPVWWAERGIKQGNQQRLRVGLAVAWLMAAAFVGNSIKDFLDLTFGWGDHAYGSIFYATVGLHLAHVIVALILGLGVQAKAWAGRYDERRHLSVEVFSLYWHFVDVVWVFVFATLFLSEHVR